MRIKSHISTPVLLMIIFGIIFAGGSAYATRTLYENYKTERIALKNELGEIKNVLRSQQEELDKTNDELETVKSDSAQKTKGLEKTLESEKQKRLADAKTLEEKIRLAEIKAAETQSQARAREESAQKKFSELEEKVSKTTYSLSSIVAQWRPIIANLECEFRYGDTGRLYSKSSGSGIVIKFGNTPDSVLTNKHVVTDESGYGASSCSIKLLDANNETITSSDMRSSSKGYDFGYIYIGNPSDRVKKLTSSFPNLCPQKPSTGDSVVILGYPSIGSKENLTATEGIVSGFDGDYFITSAKVDQGNSGGAAILLKDNCLLGIPSFAALGKVESLARILDIWTAVEK